MKEPPEKRLRTAEACQVKSRFANMMGRFVRRGENDGLPAYEKDDLSQGGPAWLFHAPIAGGKWVIGPSLPVAGQVSAFCASSTDGSTPWSVPWPPGKIESVSEVDAERERQQKEADKAAQAHMPLTVVVSSSGPQVAGEFRKITVEGEWPSYQRQSGGDGKPCWIFRDGRMPMGSRWFMGQNKPCGAQISFFFSSGSDGPSPELVEWPRDRVTSVKSSSSSSGGEKPAKTPKATGGEVEMIKVSCAASDIEGIYTKADVVQGKPAYQRKEKDCWLFWCKLSVGGRWIFGPQLPVGGSVSQFFMSDQDGETPLACAWPSQQQVKLSELDPDDEAERERSFAEAKAKLPGRLAVSVENCVNIPGGYVQSGTRDGYPVYERDASVDGRKTFIFHELHFAGGPKWYFAASNPAPGQPVSIFFASENDAPGPHMARWPIDKIDECVDADHFKPADSFKGEGLFRDSEMPHSQASLGSGLNLKERRPDGSISQIPVAWIPARFLGPADAHMELFDGISPTDLLQGRVGDCWLVAAMSCVAEFPNQVKALFKETDSEKGRYVIALYDCRQSVWRDIVVDEFIPSEVMQWWDTMGKPLFAKPNGNELWALLLEKAMAKMMGNYSALVGGNTAFAFRALVGTEDVVMWAKQGMCNQFGQIWQSSKLAKGKDVFVQDGLSSQQKAGDQMFQELLDADKSCFLMGASMDVRQGHRLENVRPDGLVEGHAYAVLSVVDMQGQKLLKLRNPWGNDKEWKGQWSDHHPIWNQFPDLRKKLRPAFEADGLFWMAWTDFLAVWDQVIICRKDVRTQGGVHTSRPRHVRQKMRMANVVEE